MRALSVIVMILLLLIFLAFGFFAVLGVLVRAREPDFIEVGMVLLLQLYALQCAIISVLALVGVGIIAAVLSGPRRDDVRIISEQPTQTPTEAQ